MEHQPLKKVCQSFSNRWFVWFFLSKTQICNQMTHNTTQLQLLLWTAISRLIIQDAEFWRRRTLKLGSKATETKANRRDKHPAIRLRWYIPSYFQHQTLCVTFVMTLRILSAGLLCKNYTTGESIMLVLCSWDSTGSDLRTAKMCDLCVKMADDVTAQASSWAAAVLSSDNIKPVAERLTGTCMVSLLIITSWWKLHCFSILRVPEYPKASNQSLSWLRSICSRQTSTLWGAASGSVAVVLELGIVHQNSKNTEKCRQRGKRSSAAGVHWGLSVALSQGYTAPHGWMLNSSQTSGHLISFIVR